MFFFKELSRKVVLEQQEENKIRLETVLEDQKTKFQSFLQDQASFFTNLMRFPMSWQAKKKKLSIVDLILLQKISEVFFFFCSEARKFSEIVTGGKPKE